MMHGQKSIKITQKVLFAESVWKIFHRSSLLKTMTQIPLFLQYLHFMYSF